jgi:GNAT superfamily N-acetyltransferase
MAQVVFRTMAADEGDAVVAMMASLYDEDASGYVSPAHFRHTVESLVRMPDRGRIVVFDAGADRCVGYAILIPYWSNEFGGSIVEVDELFVRPEFRARGVGRAFIEWIGVERPFGAIAIELEVTPENRRAQEFYRRMGFAARKNVLQVKRLGSE